MKVIAHRGDSATHPENTLTAFRSAVEKKADLIELDSYQTKDGHLVVLHDATLNRTTNAAELWGDGKHHVKEKSLEELTRLDAGSWKDEQFKGEPLPTLEESVRTINAGSVTLIERKGGSAQAYAEFLKVQNLVDQVVVQGFDWDFVAAMHTWLPGVKLGALGSGDVTEDKVQAARQTGATWAVWDHQHLNAEAIELFRKHGLRVWTYTANEEEDWGRLAALGVEAIITDKPGELRAWLAQ
jgi:glycerophosphoryl diester phosphodiesterase